MIFSIVYHEDVIKKDLVVLAVTNKKKIKQAIEKKLIEHPHIFGKPLRNSLKGYWKLRVAKYRVIFRIEKNNVKIFLIGHRRSVYTDILKRI